MAPRGTSDPAGPPRSPAPRPAPARCAPGSCPCGPRPAAVPTPGPPRRPLARLPRVPGHHGAGEPTADSWHWGPWHVGCFALPPAASGARSQLSRRRRRAGDPERAGGRRRPRRPAGRRSRSPGRALASPAARPSGLRRPPGLRPRAATWLRSARCCPACCPCTVRSAPPRAAGPQVRAGGARGGAWGLGCTRARVPRRCLRRWAAC